MNKPSVFLMVSSLIFAAAPVMAQYPYGMRTAGYGAEMWFLGLISFVVGSFIFSWIFWMVGKWMMMGTITDKESWKMGHDAGKREEINKEMNRDSNRDKESWKMGHDAGKREEINKEMNRDSNRDKESWKMGHDAGKREEINKEMNRQQSQH